MNIFANNPTVAVACIIVAIIIAMAVLFFAPVMLLVRAIRGDRRPDETDTSGINAIHAEWPSDSLSREFEQEPRGM